MWDKVPQPCNGLKSIPLQPNITEKTLNSKMFIVWKAKIFPHSFPKAKIWSEKRKRKNKLEVSPSSLVDV